MKRTLFNDTIKFKRSDLLHTSIGTRNSKSYSPLFVFNAKYAYKLDIVNGTLEKEFVDNILDATKIDSINIPDTALSMALFGINGMNGAIFLTTKKKAKINFKIAGLKMKKNRKRGDNFYQRQGNEIQIHY